MRAALGLGQVDENLYQEFQRDIRLRSMFLSGQIDQRHLGNILHEQQLKSMDQFPELHHYQRLLMNDPYQLHGDQASLHHLQQEELRRRAIAQGATQLASASAASAGSPQLAATNAQVGSAKDIAADSPSGNADKKNDDSQADAESANDSKKRARSDTAESAESNGNSKKSRGEGGGDNSASADLMSTAQNASADALLQIASVATRVPQYANVVYPMSYLNSPQLVSPQPVSLTPTLGTLGDLVNAGQNVEKFDHAASTLIGIKAKVDWPDSESEYEDDSKWEELQAKRKGDTIRLPNFSSVLPQLPEEPRIREDNDSQKKHRGILDDDSFDGNEGTAARLISRTQEHSVSEVDPGVIEYRFPIDTWWPSSAAVRRERKMTGETPPGTRYQDSEEVLGKDCQFRIDVDYCREVLANSVKPGVLEKIPHCRVHRMNMMKKKNPMAPELCHCFQVTELYPNEHMLCCSICGVWRHAACGGHFKAVSIRECTDHAFAPTCDRCHAEQILLKDFPVARKRIERQRTEQIRRGLATSAAMRQASFSKHGGTYKWPLGSVSATHIGGHTRSVHTRHDKAEKQWMDMATRLGSNPGGRAKDKVKYRTKELERLLVSVEDAGEQFDAFRIIICSNQSLHHFFITEGHMDRHNMMLFLLQDTLRDFPVGFEKHRRNIFDPADDDVSQSPFRSKLSEEEEDQEENEPSAESSKVTDDDDTDVHDEENSDNAEDSCARSGCKRKRRFDSLFCSDSCGLSCMEKDLLRTFQYASDIHPSLLRN